MKTVLELDETDVREALRQHFNTAEQMVVSVRLEARHDQGDPPVSGPRSWVEAKIEVEPRPEEPRPEMGTGT